jgi:hypothetical protein
MLHAADGIWGSPAHVEGSFPDTDPGAVPTENITHEFILSGYDASVHLGRQTQHLAEEELLLWSPVFQPGSGE